MDAIERYQLAHVASSIERISAEPNRGVALKFIEDRRRNCRPGTLANYAYALRLLDNATTGKPYRSLTRDDVADALASMSNHLGPNSLKGVSRSLIAFYRWLYADAPIPQSFLKAFVVRGRAVEHHLVSEAEFEAMLRAAVDCPPHLALRGLRDQAILQVLMDTGMRRSELVSLHHGSVRADDKGGAWLTPPHEAPRLKTGPRPVYVVKSWPALKALMAAQPGDHDEPIFRSFSDRTRGRRLWPNEVGRIVTRLRREAGLTRHITPHQFRHTEATRAARSGMGEAMMNKKLWTPGSKMAAIYVHLSREDLAERTREEAGADPLGKAIQADPKAALALAVSHGVAEALRALGLARPETGAPRGRRDPRPQS